MSYYDFLSAGTLSRLNALVWDCMIVDEAHRIKNRKAKMTQGIKQIQSIRKIALTGSPMEKNSADLWSILNFLDAYEFPAYWGWVMKNLEVTAGYFEHYKIGGPKDPEAFGRLLSPFMLRRTKEEVAPQLPEKIIIEEPVTMDPAQEEIYKAVKHTTDIEVQVASRTMLIPNALALLVRLLQVSSYPPILGFDSTPSGKLIWFDDFWTDHKDEPTVVFTRFRAPAIYLANKYNCGLIIGGERREIGSTGLLVGTIDSMGEGLNLQWAKNAVFLDAHWSTIKMTQAIDRIHRIDIKEPKNIYLLWSCREDKLVLDALNHKWSEAELVYFFLHEATEDSESQAV
jgi:SNF2 family DNA or RNA helicase